MIKRTLLTSVLIVGTALPAQSLPTCYWETTEGKMIDLSSMCGGESQTVAETSLTIPRPTRPTSNANVWTQNLFFRAAGSSISGNIHNSGSAAAENVVIEATGYATGRTPQVRSTSILRLSSNDATPVTIDFDFAVPVESWDVRIVDWD